MEVWFWQAYLQHLENKLKRNKLESLKVYVLKHFHKVRAVSKTHRHQDEREMAAVSETWPWYILFFWFERLCWQQGSVHSKGLNLKEMLFLLTFNQEGSQRVDKLFAQGGIMVAFKERIDYWGTTVNDPMTLLFIGGLMEKRFPTFSLDTNGEVLGVLRKGWQGNLKN